MAIHGDDQREADGGFRGGEYKVHASASYRSGNGWHLDARNGAPNDTNIRVYAYCLSA